MNYLDEVALAIQREVPRELVPTAGAPQLFRLYALLALTKSGDVGPKDVHDAWAVWMMERDPAHEAIKPFGNLSSDTKREDQPFVDAIRAVAGRL